MVCTRKIALQTSKQHKMNVTDVAFMHNASRIVVATVRHELCFFDSTTTELSNRVVDVPDIIGTAPSIVCDLCVYLFLFISRIIPSVSRPNLILMISHGH